MAAGRTGRRHLSLDFSRWPHADAILDEALQRPPADRDTFLRAQAGDDADLYQALAAVIAEAARDDGFLDTNASLGALLASSGLGPGDHIEHYEILGLLGRGGMGEVHRARDTRLGREVALKVLAGPFAAQPDRVARFRREAQVLASLSHPNIAAIYGVAEEAGLEALVLELVEGPTLAERIAGVPLPLSEVLAISRQLTNAIEAAHGRGVLHRDLKPANIKLMADGTVKVLDFGLAKVLAPLASPADNLTAQHPEVRLGTAPYMSPEQVRGQASDVRGDVWAFGCVLFELLSGRRAFDGDSSADVMAKVLEREPPYSLLPAGTPSPLRRLLRRCLDKDPSRRLGYIGDARLELDDAGAEPASGEGAPVAPGRDKRWHQWLPIVAAAGAGALLMWTLLPKSPPAGGETRLAITLPAGDSPVTGYQPTVAISPDGRTVVYRARHEGVTQLFARRLDALEPQPLAGTANATGPFFSPDGRWIGFDGDGVLKRVPLDGGAVVDIAAAPGGATATWLEDDTIIFATNTGRILQRVPVGGGEITALTTLDHGRGETLHLLPQAVPGHKAVLFTIASGAARELAWLPLDGSALVRLGEGSHARPWSESQLVFARAGALWTTRIDATGPTLADTPSPLFEGVAQTDQIVFHYDVAQDGTLVYLPATDDENVQELVWRTRDGQAEPANLEPRAFTRVALSPDAHRVAVAMNDRGNTDIWVGDLRQRSFTRLTSDPAIDTAPIWSPDGQWIVYRSERPGPGLFRRDAQGAAPEMRLSETDGPIHSPYGWTPDSRTVLFALFRSFSRQAIAAVTPPDMSVRVLLDGEYAQLDPQVSPDGRWLAYQSDETGRFEIYARPYPDVQAGRWTVSTRGATTPRWSPDGSELFMLEDGYLSSSRIDPGSAFRASPPVRLFPAPSSGGRLGADFEVTSGGRFLFVEPSPRTSVPPRSLIVVQRSPALPAPWRD